MNLLPSISAFCLERIEQLRGAQPAPTAIQELQTVVDYCGTLNRQAELMEGCLDKAFSGQQPRSEVRLGGKIDILNTGLGHNEIHIDGSNPIELERASRIIKDMLKRGYALFVHGKDNELVRVKRFDETQKVYIIGAEATLSPEVEEVSLSKRGKKTDEKAVPVHSAKITSVGGLDSEFRNSAEYEQFVESMVSHCQCFHPYPRPCDGVLAGGLCDRMRPI